MKKFIIRQPKPKEMEKVERLVLTSLPVANPYLDTLILTVPKPNGEKGRYIVGCVSISEGNKICQLVISEAYRRNGFGTELVKAALQKIRTRAWLRVRMWNWKAIRMYWKLGFRIIGIHKGRSFTMAQPDPALYTHTGEKRVIVENGKLLKLLYPANRREYRNMSKVLTFDQSRRAFVVPATIPDLIRDEEMIEMTIPSAFSWRKLAEIYTESHHFDSSDDYEVYHIMYSGRIQGGAWNKWETKDGRWIVRFSKHMYKYYNVKLSAATKRILSTIVSEMLGTTKVYIQLCTRFNKTDGGKFGDPGSCWYNQQPYHPECLFSGGHGYIFKVYDANNKGVSRAWLYYEPDTLIMFNGRGRLKHKLADLLSAYLGIPYKENVRVEIGDNKHGHYTDGEHTVFSTNIKSKYVMRWCDGPTIRD